MSCRRRRRRCSSLRGCLGGGMRCRWSRSRRGCLGGRLGWSRTWRMRSSWCVGCRRCFGWCQRRTGRCARCRRFRWRFSGCFSGRCAWSRRLGRHGRTGRRIELFLRDNLATLVDTFPPQAHRRAAADLVVVDTDGMLVPRCQCDATDNLLTAVVISLVDDQLVVDPDAHAIIGNHRKGVDI
jgi:hypothetical protein